MKRLSITLATLVTLALASHAQAWDAAKGAEKAKQVCAACHGEKGTEAKVPGAPILAGQYRDYLQQALRDYKSGKRKNAIMSGQVQGLNEDDMRNLAAYYASQPGPLKVVR
jgi:cytochrome c553